MLQRPHGICLLAALVSANASVVRAQSTANETMAVEVVLEGLSEQLRTNVVSLLSIEQQKADPALNEDKLRTLHRKAPQEIREALEPLGHYRSNVRSELKQEGERWVARYVIEPGPPLRVEKVDLRIFGAGADDPEFAALANSLPLREGETLQHANYDQSKSALLNLATERGYFDARLLTSELRIDLSSYTATAVLHIDTGRRYRFGALRFQQSFFKEDFLTRFAEIKPGDPYSSAALLQLQTALSATEYFQQVDVQPRRDQARDLEIPVDVLLTLRPPNKYTFGIGYGTDTGVRGKLGWERRLINSSGDHFITEIEASGINQTASARYLIPVLNPRTDQMFLGASVGDIETDTSNSTISAVGTGLNFTRGNWRQTLMLNYQNERFVTGSDSGDTRLLIPAVSWTHITADNRSFPRHGSRVQLELRGANEAVAADLSFWSARLGVKYIFPIGDTVRVVTRADAGYTETPDFHELPASQRFYTGGSLSVRGYSYQSLGPVDKNGDVIGGRYLAVGSIEIEQRLWKILGAAIFFDTGKAFNESSEKFNDGAGVGLRVHLPLGVIQLDVAQAISRDDRPWRVHFAIGAEL